MPEELVAVLVEEDLRRYGLDAVLGGSIPVFPHVDEFDRELAFVLVPQLFQNGLHHLARDAFGRAQVQKPRELRLFGRLACWSLAGDGRGSR